ncbi:MAG: hypothetical protein UU37_C0007G0012 [Candidatus Gottesmanbacteria bacterium GW2011_GWA2_41_12]|uniref:Glycosyltransferase RgtA/B/C/D-like domain-containing protein n=2 Tax=Candidatus Gottesmaniibacteriota TaxID=1752720 RepID=A0A0G0WV12_9BACT|nr:MAG: hypothetical protein UT63_C0029G0012 [Candidatus Gottesmanbacteria bacterium GW2011_GWC2_39_8]KKR88295.1 MAG: hypothetical protein UU37_C0007G0012 [Candidatus Gottesmanbacteria bacterium GW2011_GWA2_41_12]
MVRSDHYLHKLIIMKVLYREWVAVAIIIFTLISLAVLPLLYWVALSGSDTVFPLIHNFRLDYFYYLHLMKQGLDGNLLVISRFTPENFTPRLGMTLFPILGKLSVFLGSNLPLTYTLSRIVFGIVLLAVIYKFIRLVYPESKVKRVVSFLFVSFSSTFWFVRNDGGKLLVENAFGNWTSFDTLHRAIFLPHHLLSYISMVLVLIFLFGKKRSAPILQGNALSQGIALRENFLIAFFTILSGLTNPGTFLGLGMIVFFSGFILHANRSGFRLWASLRLLRGRTSFFAAFVLTVFYLNWLQNTNFPWTAVRDEERKWVFAVTFPDYLGGIGPLFFPAVAGIFFWVRQKISTIKVVTLIWFIVPFIGLFILPGLLPVSNQRLFEWGHYIPIAILAAEGIFEVTRRIGGKKLLFSLLISLFLYSGISIYGTLVHDFGVFDPNVYNIYIPKDIFPAFAWLDRNTPENSVVLSQGYMGNLIPAYAHNKVVVGHPTLTYKSAEKDQEVGKFFRQDNMIFSKNMIDKYNVSYIFFSLDTPPPNEEFLKTLGTKEVFASEKLRIYEVESIQQ